MKRIALIGECMVELNGTIPDLTQTYGGDTLNCATYLSRLVSDDVETSFVSAIGTDSLSMSIKQSWRRDGINTDLVLHSKHNNMGLYLISVDGHGERSFQYWRNDSAAKFMFQHQDIDLIFSQLQHFDMVVTSGISLAILSPEDRLDFIGRLSHLKNDGVTIVFDSNYRPKLWASKAETIDVYNQVFSLSDIALVTSDDEHELFGDADIEATYKRISSGGCSQVIIKDGADGSVYFDSGVLKRVDAQPITVVDTTSAGDSFNAGFISGYLSDATIETCCAKGNQVASIVIQHKGAICPRSAIEHLKWK